MNSENKNKIGELEKKVNSVALQNCAFLSFKYKIITREDGSKYTSYIWE